MAKTASRLDAAAVPAEQRSRRGTWSLVAVGFSVLLLLLVTVSVGIEGYAVSREFQAALASDAVSAEVVSTQNAELALSRVETARLTAAQSGDPADLARLHSLVEQFASLTGGAWLATVDPEPAISRLRMLVAGPGLAAPIPEVDALQRSIARRLQTINAEAGPLQEDWAHWRKRAFRLVFLTNNLAMLLLITGGGLLLLYAGWHIDSRQKLLEARRSVLKAERDRASFVAAAGHDLRQPLQAMSLFITTLSHGSNDPAVKALADKIAASAASMRRMINGLLDVAKLDAGLVSADQVDQALDDLLAGLGEEFERQAEAKGIALVIESTNVVVHTDPLLLESIVRNLLANAINYTTQGVVHVSVSVAGRMAKITVRDTGPGIAAEQISLIFKDFYRIGGSGGGGLGLGLGIVQRLAKLIHARITVESALGSGTSFIVEVAMGVNQPTTMPLQMPDQMPLPIVNDTFATPVRLLLVDDNEPLRHAMAQHLTALGAGVTQAQDVRHAGQVLRNLATPIDVAVADYDLGPGKTGLELLLMLNDRIGEEVPGVIITGSEDPDVIRALDDSDFEWFQKPIDIAVLWDAIIRARASVPPRAPAVPQLPGAISARSALPP